MADFVEAWDRKTGKKLDYLVPKAHLTSPLFKNRLSGTPIQKKAPTTTNPAAQPAKKEK